MNAGRTAKSFTNSWVSIASYLGVLIANFFSRKVFIEHLGLDILGLNTTATNLLGMLNLSELGIGTAVSFALYKPIIERDKDAIIEIVSLQGWLYKNIALIVLLGGITLMLFFHQIFSGMKLPLWYAYASFSVLLFSSLLGYFVNYKQVVISANQEHYKVNFITKTIVIVKIIVQIIAISNFQNGYLWWLVLEILFSLLNSLGLYYLVKKEFPWLNCNYSIGRKVYSKYSSIIVRVKQLFFHKIAGFALTQVPTLIILSFTSLSVVAIYGNYMLVITGVLALITSLFNGITPSFGNLIVSSEKDYIYQIFNEYSSFRLVVAGICSYAFFVLIDPFINTWLGSGYLFNKSTTLLLSIFLYFQVSRVSDIFIEAFGIFSDIWAPVAEALINILLSIVLGYFFGLNGILIGINISLLLIVLIWKPIFVHKYGFQIFPGSFFRKYTIYSFLTLALGYLLFLIFNEYITVSLRIAKLVPIFQLFAFIVFFSIFYLVFDNNNSKPMINRLLLISKKKQ